MSHSFQRLVDVIAEQLSCHVVVESADHLVLASARAPGPTTAVMRRPVHEDPSDPCRSDDVPVALGAVHLDDEVAMELRRHRDGSPGVGLVVRDDGGVVVGRLWSHIPPEGLHGSAVEALRRLAPQIRQHLARIDRTVTRMHQMHSHDVRALLDGPMDTREHAAQDLLDDRAFPSGSGVLALVVRLADPGRAPLPPADRAQPDHAAGERGALVAPLEEVLRRVRVRGGVDRSLHLSRPDHGVLLVAAADDGRRSASGWATRLLSEAEASIGRADLTPVVAVGEPQADLADATRSYRQALHAAAVAAALPEFAPLATWSELGVYGLLADLDPDRLAMVVPTELADLQAVDDGHLLETLETFLDQAGQVKATAAALFLHRASLYQRLRRIEELTGMDLDDGQVRLRLHLGVKAARVLRSLRGTRRHPRHA